MLFYKHGNSVRTENPAYFEAKDTAIVELLKNQEFCMLPQSLPKNITDVSYFYNWEYNFENDCLTLDISWTYQKEEDYLKAKSKMQVYDTVDSQVEDGFYMIYAIGNSNEDKKHFSFGYDDRTNRVTYQIYYEW